ncbi:hypothetical protein EAO27_19780 [Sphingopyxis sp. YF1]|uniref:hypothetical protein n=1 Tax=Sphingopyxis sp. YF1 TaxID=2482763 RepID=UPI001F607916|nr:hypothetical protein [Sphingopyxis sp. YF1]UNU44698.1 hypothetical protein EAO27_19780 [Sphingopyxis sp. YF1]
MDIHIRRGLAEAWALAATHRNMLAAYVGIGVVVPFLFLSSEPIFSLRNLMALASNPWTGIYGSIAGPLYLLGIVAVIAAGAMLAAWNGVLAEMREGFLSEIMYGMVAGFAYLLANLVLAIGTGLVATLPLFVVGFDVLLSDGVTRIALEAYRLLLSLIGGWIGARLCLAGAIMGGRGKLEPVSAFLESWRRTRTAQWRLYGFYLLYGLVFGIAAGGLLLLHGAVILANEPGTVTETLMSFGWILLFALYFLGQVLIPAGFVRAAEPAANAAEIFA